MGFSMKKATELTIVGWRLKHAIKERGITQAELARALDVSQALISRAINGTISRTYTLERMAEYLNVSPAYLVGNSDEMNPDINAGFASEADAGDIEQVLTRLYTTFPADQAMKMIATIKQHALQTATH